jgi:hypothetical protein
MATIDSRESMHELIQGAAAAPANDRQNAD